MTDSRYLPAPAAGVFLVAVLVFAWLGLRGRLDEVGDALRDTSSLGVGAVPCCRAGSGCSPPGCCGSG